MIMNMYVVQDNVKPDIENIIALNLPMGEAYCCSSDYAAIVA
jgi:hypothetical protein